FLQGSKVLQHVRPKILLDERDANRRHLPGPRPKGPRRKIRPAPHKSRANARQARRAGSWSSPARGKIFNRFVLTDSLTARLFVRVDSRPTQLAGNEASLDVDVAHLFR